MAGERQVLSALRSRVDPGSSWHPEQLPASRTEASANAPEQREHSAGVHPVGHSGCYLRTRCIDDWKRFWKLDQLLGLVHLSICRQIGNTAIPLDDESKDILVSHSSSRSSRAEIRARKSFNEDRRAISLSIMSHGIDHLCVASASSCKLSPASCSSSCAR
jgi:hypothetical protein